MTDREEITNSRQSEASEGLDEAVWNSEAAERRGEIGELGKIAERKTGVKKRSRSLRIVRVQKREEKESN